MTSEKRASAGRLTAERWTSAALEAIAEGGLAAVSIERLARELGATKGSFYWHFENREALIAASLSEWETGETIAVAKMLAPLPDARSRLRVLLEAAMDDRPGARVEGALLSDSHIPAVRASLDRAMRARIGYLEALFELIGADAPGQRATTAFALYLGLLHLRRTGSEVMPHGRELEHYVEQVVNWLDGSDADERAAARND